MFAHCSLDEYFELLEMFFVIVNRCTVEFPDLNLLWVF